MSGFDRDLALRSVLGVLEEMAFTFAEESQAPPAAVGSPCPMSVEEASSGVQLQAGLVLIALGTSICCWEGAGRSSAPWSTMARTCIAKGQLSTYSFAVSLGLLVATRSAYS